MEKFGFLFLSLALVYCIEANVVKVQKSTLPQPPVCGQDSANEVQTGKDTLIDQYPWTGLVEYYKGRGRKGYNCVGTLINERYVLLSAHCVKGAPSNWRINKVRFGDWDIQKDNDCNENQICAEPVQDIDVEKVIVHSDYDVDKAHKNDIALIRLSEKVKFTKFVKPICLPTGSTKLSDSGLKITGWGLRLYSSSKKQHFDVEAESLESCNVKYKKLGQNALTNAQICAGDECLHGPLMKKQNNVWQLTGILSYGPKECTNKEVPSVYTRVAAYMDWIVTNMEA